MITVTATPVTHRTWPVVLAVALLLVLAASAAITGELGLVASSSEPGVTPLWERIVALGGFQWIR